PAVSGSCRNGDDQIVNKAADREAGKDAGARSEPCCQRCEEISVGEIPKGRIPAAAPEIAQTGRLQRAIHQWPRLELEPPPHAGHEMKRPEMKRQHNPYHSHPTD